MIIRKALATDIPWLVEQLKEFSKFFGGKFSLFPGEDEAAKILNMLIATQPFWVAQLVDETRVGFVAGVLHPHLLNPALIVLTELFWWVVPEHRGGRAGLQLLNELHHFGLQHADWIVFTLEAESPVNPQTLERRGFRLKERNYILEVG